MGGLVLPLESESPLDDLCELRDMVGEEIRELKLFVDQDRWE